MPNHPDRVRRNYNEQTSEQPKPCPWCKDTGEVGPPEDKYVCPCGAGRMLEKTRLQCPLGENCACAIFTRHEAFEAFCKERDKTIASDETLRELVHLLERSIEGTHRSADSMRAKGDAETANIYKGECHGYRQVVDWLYKRLNPGQIAHSKSQLKRLNAQTGRPLTDGIEKFDKR